jgi:predicted nicotinamide N-methyase
MTTPTAPEVLHTTAGDLPLEEVQLGLEGRTWSILHTGAVISREAEEGFLRGEATARRPYGIVLWPAAIALAHEVASRAVAGKRVLELGAGTGLPGIVAASLGAHVVQTDRQQLVLHVCKQNAERNGVSSIEHRTADWTAWEDAARYDLILGSDILYAGALHPHLRHIFETNLAPGGTVLLADPFRETSLRLLEAMEAEGWRVTMDKWTVGIAPPPRPVGVFALTRP